MEQKTKTYYLNLKIFSIFKKMVFTVATFLPTLYFLFYYKYRRSPVLLFIYVTHENKYINIYKTYNHFNYSKN